ncbi:MAG TPA: serine hydrolase [Candidatus Eisenbacteria bacterium]|nr:serine hydrolase [Candidatus Eisenbacteria bacterium]
MRTEKRVRMVRFVVLSAIAVAELCVTTRAQDKKSAAVDEVFADVAKPGSPGCALAVVRSGKAIYEKGYGLANIEQNVSITPQSVFDIGSTSKQFTAASILLLEKQGKLSLNDDIRKYLPEIPDYGHRITILHLLNHTSGLRDYLTLFELAGINTDSVTTDEDALAIIANQKALNFEPGSEWLYSNSGFFLLSVIVQRVSGKTLTEFATENIFAPLEMKHTVYRDSHTLIVPNRTLAYDSKEKEAGYSINVSYFEQTGDGAVHTSVEDLLKWDENFYSGKLGGKEFLAEMQEPGKLNSGKPLTYAKGLVVEKYRGLPIVEHGGSWGGYRAQLLRFPEQHFSVACLCNVGNAGPEKRALRVADIYLAEEMKEPLAREKEGKRREKKETVAMAPDKLAGYAGKFRSEELRATYRLEIEDGKLILKGIQSGDGFLHSPERLELRPVGADAFVVDEEGLQFAFQHGGSGNVSGFRLDAGRTKGLEFQRN